MCDVCIISIQIMLILGMHSIELHIENEQAATF